MWSLKPGKTEERVIIFGCISNQGSYRFLIKNSRLFPDSSLSNRWSIETLKKCRNKAFSMRCWRDLIRFDQQEKNFTCEALLFQKKKKRIFTLFSNLYFPDFFQVWKIAGQIPRLSQEFKTLYKPWRIDKKSKLYELVHTTIENSK